MKRPDQKVVGDWLIATKETIYQLQNWLRFLEHWREVGQVNSEEFNAACRQLSEAGLWGWARDAGGHGIEALAETFERRDIV